MRSMKVSLSFTFRDRPSDASTGMRVSDITLEPAPSLNGRVVDASGATTEAPRARWIDHLRAHDVVVANEPTAKVAAN